MLISAAVGVRNVIQAHFDRHQHNKVFIERNPSGKGELVLFGSMNFSVRGLHVQMSRRTISLSSMIWGRRRCSRKGFDIDFNDNVRLCGREGKSRAAARRFAIDRGRLTRRLG